MIVIIIDDREHYLSPILTQLTKNSNDIKVIIKRIEIGDFAIIHVDEKKNSEPTILAVIERKTLSDFAAGFKDGRYNNKEKMIEYRNKNKCSVIFLIEGQSYPSPDKKFGKISYKYIESAIFHMMCRDNITFIYSKDNVGSAETLIRFAISMETMMVKHYDKVIASREPIETEQIDTEQDKPIDTKQDKPIEPPALGNIIGGLCEKNVKSDEQILTELWSVFPGITTATAHMFYKTYSLADVIFGRLDITAISEMKYLGKKISIRACKGLINIPDSIYIRLLEVLPGISLKTAKHIVCSHKLTEIINFDIAELASLIVNEKSLGVHKATRIKKYLFMKI